MAEQKKNYSKRRKIKNKEYPLKDPFFKGNLVVEGKDFGGLQGLCNVGRGVLILGQPLRKLNMPAYLGALEEEG